MRHTLFTKMLPKKKLVIKDTPPRIITTNRGTGAGGANTNANGLSYEDNTNLEECFHVVEKNKFKKVKFHGYDNEMMNVNKSKLYAFMNHIGEKSDLQQAAGCKLPDEAYIDVNRKNVFIIEKKFQQTPGSVDEKIQTAPFKKKHYSLQFPKYTVYYMYCLSDWFKREEYVSVLEYLASENIPIFWGEEPNYKQDIISFMCGK